MFIRMNKKSPLTVLNFLIGANEAVHMREITRKTSLSLGFISRTLNELSKEGLITLRKKGRMKFYRINTANPLVKQLKILITISDIMPVVNRLKGNAVRIILFGSAARGENTPESDIDLFVLTNNPAYSRKHVSRDQKIAPIIMNSSEYVTLKAKDASLYDQITRGITLWEHE